MRRPNAKLPSSPGIIKSRTPDNLPDPQLNPKDFEQLIRNRGIRFKLEKSAYCPNFTNIDTQQHDPNCKLCDGGLVYYSETIISGILQNQKLERFYEVQGLWNVGECICTFSAYDDDGRAIDLAIYDKLSCLDYESRFVEVLEHSPTGIDRLKYPATSVEFLRTTDKIYYVDSDFVITPEGYISWRDPANQPSYNQSIQKGQIITISYCYKPVFLITQILHELRATKAFDPVTNTSVAIRLPQMVLLRLHFHMKQDKDKVGLPNNRAPRSGTLTPE